ncbi:unnamed protein product [Closterium sp. NIES-54]
MFLMVEDVKGSEGDVGSVGKVVMHPLTHWVIDSGCTSHMTPRADLLDEVKPPGKIKFVAAASGALLPVIGVGMLSCRAKLGKLLLWDLEEKSSCIKDLWQLPIIPWNGKPPATAAAVATAKTTAGGEETAPIDGALDAVKKVQQSQQPHGVVLAGVDATAAWAKASSGNEKEQFLMLLVYVDDILLFSKSSAMIERVEEMLEMQINCSKMGDVKYYLVMHVERDLDKGVLRLHQRKYCEGLAEKYGLQDGGKPATPLPSGLTVELCADEEVVGESDRKLFHSMVGALNYAANHTQPDIAFATSRLASVVSRPSHEQLEAAKRLVRYVSAMASVGLEYSAVRQRLQRGAADLGKGEMLQTCYTDASFNSMKADGTSIGGYVCLFGGGAVSWRSKKQNEVGLSSCETEYMALHHGAKEVVWLRRLLEEIGVCQKEPTVIFCDNESAVKLAKNACLHGLTKHIRPKWHWVRRLLDKEVRLEIVKTHQQAADILTKRLAEYEHWKGMKLAGMSVH